MDMLLTLTVHHVGQQLDVVVPHFGLIVLYGDRLNHIAQKTWIRLNKAFRWNISYCFADPAIQP